MSTYFDIIPQDILFEIIDKFTDYESFVELQKVSPKVNSLSSPILIPGMTLIYSDQILSARFETHYILFM